MQHTQKHLSITFTALCVMLLTVIAADSRKQIEVTHSAANGEPVLEAMGPGLPESFLVEGRALQEKLRAEGSILSNEVRLAAALYERNALLQRSIDVVVEHGGPVPTTWTFKLSDHPDWLVLHPSVLNPRFELSTDALEKAMTDGTVPLHRAISVHLEGMTHDGDIYRFPANLVAREGFAFDTSRIASQIAEAVHNGDLTFYMQAEKEAPTVTITTESGTEELELIGTGHSTFEDSVENREFNVRKTFTERLNGVVIPDGNVFSYVDTLGGPVTLEKGWKEALGLFGGGAAMTPGGGICQGATTVYRAALLTGMPIVEKRNHSMFVHYYEKYGVGLDATIFPGFHDMRFKNDTGHIMVMQAYLEGKEAYVSLYGKKDTRQVTMEGPYFHRQAQQMKAKTGRWLSHDEIGWKRTVVYPDGTEKTNTLVSTYYKGIPRKVIDKYSAMDTNTVLHAAAY